MNNTPNNNANMNNLTFTPAIANPADLKAHPILIEMGYGNKADIYFIETMKYFNHYDRPVADMDNNVITHWPDIEAAIANGIMQMEIYRVDMTVIQLRRFIAMKHRYHRMNLIASYNTVKFFEDYLTHDAEGILLAESIDGKTTREKIAQLMQTSDSTVKRLKEIGDAKPEKLGLIEQGFASFKSVQDEIKAERHAAETARRKAEIATPVEPIVETPIEEYYVEPTTKDDEEAVSVPPPAEPFYLEPEPVASLSEEVNGEEYYESKEMPEDNSVAPLKFEGGSFSIEGLGTFNISITDNVASVMVNGVTVPNMDFTTYADDNGKDGTVHSFVLSQPGKNALCFQLTIENISKAA